MARMVPPEVHRGTSSAAERKVFTALEQDLGDSWVALHSVGLTGHRVKPWAEIDFVLIGPSGVYCLEVKGGRVARVEGRWHYTDRNGSTAIKDQGPFEQVGPASAALRQHLVAKDSTFAECIVGYGVILPDIPFSIEGPDLEPEVVFDASDWARPISAYVERLAAYWHKRIKASHGRKGAPLNKEGIHRLFESLRGDFDLRPTLRSRVDEAYTDLVRLTEEQYRVLDSLSDNDRVIVRGGAGTGKTLFAVEEARRRAVSGEKVFLTCFNANLGHELGAAVSDLPTINAGHFHGQIAEIIDRAAYRDRLPMAQPQDLFPVFYPRVGLEALVELDELEVYDSIVVDEAQDLLTELNLDFLDALLKGGLPEGVWRILLDHKQDAFSGTSPAGLARLNLAGPAKYTLSVNCRNTEPIAVRTCQLTGLPLPEVLRVNGPEVVLHWWRDESHERREASKAVNRLLGSGLEPSEIIVLGSRRLENTPLREGLENVPYPLRTYEPGLDRKRVIAYSTTSAFKGLEANAVLLIDIVDLDSDEALLSAYVGASRARVYLEIFIAEAISDQYNERAREFGEHLAHSKRGATPSGAA